MKLPFEDAKKTVIGAVNATENMDSLIKILKAELKWMELNKKMFYSR
jgi:hypothetical protein